MPNVLRKSVRPLPPSFKMAMLIAASKIRMRVSWLRATRLLSTKRHTKMTNALSKKRPKIRLLLHGESALSIYMAGLFCLNNETLKSWQMMPIL